MRVSDGLGTSVLHLRIWCRSCPCSPPLGARFRSVDLRFLVVPHAPHASGCTLRVGGWPAGHNAVEQTGGEQDEAHAWVSVLLLGVLAL